MWPPGSKIRCISRNVYNKDKIIVGSEYTVDEREAHEEGAILLTEIEEEYGASGWWFHPADFELVSESNNFNDAWNRAMGILS